MTELERKALEHCVATLANILWRQINHDGRTYTPPIRADYDRMLDLLEQLTRKPRP